MKFRYTGPDIDAVLDRLPTAEVLQRDETGYTVQAETFGRLFDEGLLAREKINDVLSELKGNQKEKLTIKMDKIRELIPESVPESQYENYICNALQKVRRDI